jgi:hypothetical protein
MNLHFDFLIFSAGLTFIQIEGFAKLSPVSSTQRSNHGYLPNPRPSTPQPARVLTNQIPTPATPGSHSSSADLRRPGSARGGPGLTGLAVMGPDPPIDPALNRLVRTPRTCAGCSAAGNRGRTESGRPASSPAHTAGRCRAAHRHGARIQTPEPPHTPSHSPTTRQPVRPASGGRRAAGAAWPVRAGPGVGEENPPGALAGPAAAFVGLATGREARPVSVRPE